MFGTLDSLDAAMMSYSPAQSLDQLANVQPLGLESSLQDIERDDQWPAEQGIQEEQQGMPFQPIGSHFNQTVALAPLVHSVGGEGVSNGDHQTTVVNSVASFDLGNHFPSLAQTNPLPLLQMNDNSSVSGGSELDLDQFHSESWSTLPVPSREQSHHLDGQVNTGPQPMRRISQDLPMFMTMDPLESIPADDPSYHAYAAQRAHYLHSINPSNTSYSIYPSEPYGVDQPGPGPSTQ